MNVLLNRPTQVVVVLFFALIASANAIQVWLSARSQSYLGEIRSTLDSVAATQRVGLKLMRMLSYDLSEEWPLDVVELEGVTTDLATTVSRFSRYGERDNVARLERAVAVLRQPAMDRRAATADSLYLIREALHGETVLVSEVLGEVGQSMRTESHLGAAALLMLSLLVLSVLLLLYRRVFRPLALLRGLLVRLGEDRFDPVEVSGLDRLVQPLFENYNQMVRRLGDLEQIHREHAVTLEQQVRAATGALLLQQSSLARAERLAAVGELAAQVAHELRNPLAGIQMALSNLRRESTDPEVTDRLNLVISELQRITRLLSDLLGRARHAPEAPAMFRLAPVVDELVRLVRYQLPANVTLQVDVDPELTCDMPQDGFRQAILNLVLNSARAIGDRAGTVFIRGRRSGPELIVTVTDDGPGYPAGVVAGQVRPFASQSEGGTGLGLTIVQRFAREMDGKLRLSNAPAGGAVAELVLPLMMTHA